MHMINILWYFLLAYSTASTSQPSVRSITIQLHFVRSYLPHYRLFQQTLCIKADSRTQKIILSEILFIRKQFWKEFVEISHTTGWWLWFIIIGGITYILCWSIENYVCIPEWRWSHSHIPSNFAFAITPTYLNK